MFFTVTSVLMLVAVLLGFAPTFFLRQAFFDTALSPFLVVHGTVMTAWFVVHALQAYLAQSRRFGWHRRLGWLGVAVAVLVVATTPPVLVRSVPNGLSAGLPEFAVSFIVMTGVLRVVFFAAMVAAAIWWRRQRTVHTRALFFASLSNVAPATSRMAGVLGWNVVLVAFAYLVPFAVALIQYDRQTLARTHPLSSAGIAAVFVILLVPIGLVLAGASNVVVASLR
jgi:hypothetical protein